MEEQHFNMEAIAFAARQGSGAAKPQLEVGGMSAFDPVARPHIASPTDGGAQRFGSGGSDCGSRSSVSPQFRRSSPQGRGRDGEDSDSSLHRPSSAGGSGSTSKRQREGRSKVGREEVVKRACEPCRRSKIKCSNEIPCAHCKSRGIEHSCVPCGNPGRVTLPREPLAIHDDGTFSHQSQVDEAFFKNLPMSELRWGSEKVAAWLKGLPAGVQGSLMQGLKITKHQWSLNVPPDPQWAGPSGPMGSLDSSSRTQSAQSTASGGLDDADYDALAIVNSMEHDLWSGHPSIGVFQADFHPKRGQVAVYANQRFASILGLHRQEFLQQIVQSSVNLAIPHIDLAFLVFEDFERPMASFTETAFRVLPHGKDQYVYIKAQKQRSFDRYGCLTRVTHFWESVSAAVFRSMREMSTEAKLGAGRSKSSSRAGKQQSAIGPELGVTVQEMAMSGDDEDQYQVELLEQYARKVVGGMSRSSSGNSTVVGAMAVHAAPASRTQSWSFEAPPSMAAGASNMFATRTMSAQDAPSSRAVPTDMTSWVRDDESKGMHFQQLQHFQHQQFQQKLAQQQQQQQQQQQHQFQPVPQHQQQLQQQHQFQPVQQHQQQQHYQQQQQQQQQHLAPRLPRALPALLAHAMTPPYCPGNLAPATCTGP